MTEDLSEEVGRKPQSENYQRNKSPLSGGTVLHSVPCNSDHTVFLGGFCFFVFVFFNVLVVFQDRVSRFLPRADLRLQSSHLRFLCSWDYRHHLNTQQDHNS
jgi:hypothetical protein